MAGSDPYLFSGSYKQNKKVMDIAPVVFLLFFRKLRRNWPPHGAFFPHKIQIILVYFFREYPRIASIFLRHEYQLCLFS